jgi:DNA repair exonuclease SbcCD nuclease subunit
MKFIHTADLHLKKDKQNGLKVLQWLCDKADTVQADYIVIAGDLFDTDTDAIQLRQAVKKICDSTNTSFLVIPGNHDLKSFGPDCDYGKRVIPMIDTPFHIVEHNGLTICGVPYQKKKFIECIQGLPENTDVLILHGTIYDETFIFTELDDEETKYMPIFPDQLGNIARYVAMGHLHSRNLEMQYKSTRVVYPGSPVALDTKCKSERVCYLVEIDQRSLSYQHVTVAVSSHYAACDYFVFPGYEEEILTQVDSFITQNLTNNVMPLISIRGFIGESDKLFQKSVHELRERYQDKFTELRITTSVQTWEKISQHLLVKKFIRKTENIDSRLRMRMYAIVLPIFDKTLK